MHASASAFFEKIRFACICVYSSPRESEFFSPSFSLPRRSLTESVSRNREDVEYLLLQQVLRRQIRVQVSTTRTGSLLRSLCPPPNESASQPRWTRYLARFDVSYVISRRYLCAWLILFLLCFFLVFSHPLRLPLQTCRNTSFKWPNWESSCCQFALLLAKARPAQISIFSIYCLFSV